MSCLRKILAGRSKEGHIGVAVLILCVMLVLALSIKILPVLVAEQQLGTLATELYREAEIADRIGNEMSRRAAVLREKTGLNSETYWSASGRIQLNEEATMQLTYHYNLGLFGGPDFFPITLRAAAIGKSEVHWK